jgi:hypothetical protein
VVGRGEGGERKGGEKEERGVKEEEAATMLDDEVDGTLSPPFEPLEGEWKREDWLWESKERGREEEGWEDMERGRGGERNRGREREGLVIVWLSSTTMTSSLCGSDLLILLTAISPPPSPHTPALTLFPEPKDVFPDTEIISSSMPFSLLSLWWKDFIWRLYIPKLFCFSKGSQSFLNHKGESWHRESKWGRGKRRRRGESTREGSCSESRDGRGGRWGRGGGRVVLALRSYTNIMATGWPLSVASAVSPTTRSAWLRGLQIHGEGELLLLLLRLHAGWLLRQHTEKKKYERNLTLLRNATKWEDNFAFFG